MPNSKLGMDFSELYDYDGFQEIGDGKLYAESFCAILRWPAVAGRPEGIRRHADLHRQAIEHEDWPSVQSERRRSPPRRQRSLLPARTPLKSGMASLDMAQNLGVSHPDSVRGISVVGFLIP